MAARSYSSAMGPARAAAATVSYRGRCRAAAEGQPASNGVGGPTSLAVLIGTRMVGRRVDSRPKHRVGMRDGHRIDAESDDSYAHLGAGDPSGRIAGGDQGADAFCDRRSARLEALERNANESVLDLE